MFRNSRPSEWKIVHLWFWMVLSKVSISTDDSKCRSISAEIKCFKIVDVDIKFFEDSDYLWPMA